MKFYLLNVFTTAEVNSGNQLAVVLLDNYIPDEEMLAITRNFDFSETVFIFEQKTLRIFTTHGELPFAGHPTIGAGWLISQITKAHEFSLQAPLGRLKVLADQTSATVTFPGAPVIKENAIEVTGLLTLFNLKPTDAYVENIKLVNVGPEFLVIPLRSHEALKNISLPATNVVWAYFFFEDSSSNFHVRMLGTREDAATGSAACALAGFLRNTYERKTGKITISQGVEMKRPSEIKITWDEKNILLSGKVTKWGEGDL